MWQDEAEEHLPRIASTQVLYSVCLKIPAPVVLLRGDILSNEAFKEKHALSPWGCKARTSLFSFWEMKQTKKNPSNYINSFKNVLRSIGRQRHERSFLQRSLQWWRAAVGPFVLHIMKCIQSSLWLRLQISPSYPTSCHFKLCLHPNCLGCVGQWIFFTPKKEESNGSLYSPRRAEHAAGPARRHSYGRLSHLSLLGASLCCGYSSPCGMALADRTKGRWNAPRVT